MRLLLAVYLFVAFATGCYAHQYETGATPERAPALERWNHHAIAGFFQISDALDLRGLCPRGVARIVNYRSLTQVAIGLATFEIWTPTTEEVWCARGPQ